ncbi:MAG: Methyltransferase type 11 [Solirubrobacterales bacterium]|nr:Methyltransferase type 11 [Solirubrobacterales bacterium]
MTAKPPRILAISGSASLAGSDSGWRSRRSAVRRPLSRRRDGGPLRSSPARSNRRSCAQWRASRSASPSSKWDNAFIPRFWLVRDHLPEFTAARKGRPSLVERAVAIDADTATVTIPWDCVDGFFPAYWRRPHAYLQEQVGRGTWVCAGVGPRVEQRAVAALAADLASSAWHKRNRTHLCEADLGARLLVTS